MCLTMADVQVQLQDKLANPRPAASRQLISWTAWLRATVSSCPSLPLPVYQTKLPQGTGMIDQNGSSVLSGHFRF